MDHLLLPKNSTAPPSRVPLVCQPLEGGNYWEGDFVTHAAHADARWRHFTLPDNLAYRYRYYEAKSPSPDGALQEFFQRWLFFGLLHAAFAPEELYQEQDYIEEHEGGRYITTKKLATTLTEWATRIRALDITHRSQRCHQLHACTSKAHSLLICLTLDSPSHQGFHLGIRHSLIVLYDTISAAWDMLFEDISGDLVWRPAMTMYGGFDSDQTKRMKKNGWCPSVISFENKNHNSVAFRHFISGMKHLPALDHSECDDKTCKKEQIDDTYQKIHTTESCDCEMIGPNPQEVEEILLTGTYPVLDVIGDSAATLEVNVRPYKPGMAYVAISHVWAQGMGNRTALALPACQILRMRKSVTKIIGQKFTWKGEDNIKETGPLLLWCDTLLCPVSITSAEELEVEALAEFNNRPDVVHAAHMKALALKHMRRVYTDAKYVLVLEKGLEAVNYAELSSIEAGIRLITSQWMQRLWTYQEAALPEKLVMQFKDKTVDYYDVIKAVRDTYRNDIVLRSLCFTLTNRMLLLRALRYMTAERPNDLFQFSETLTQRRCSKAEDEPLCAATLLNQDIALIVTKDTAEDRMAVFWQEYAKKDNIPHNIIFRSVPRLSKEGMRWAPRDFRQTLFRLSDPQPTRLTPEGLHAKVGSWQIGPNVLPWIPQGFLMQNLANGRTMILVRDAEDDRWYKVTLSDDGPAGLQFWRTWVGSTLTKLMQWFILFEGVMTAGDPTSHGLLGMIDTNLPGPPVVRSVCTLAVNTCIGDELVTMRASYDHAQTLRSCQEYRVFQEVWLRDIVFGAVLKGWPVIKKMSAARFLYRIFMWLGRFHATKVILKYQTLRSMANQTAEVRAAIESIQGTTPGDNDTFMSANIIQIFHGQYASIVRKHDRSKEWCVD